MIDLKFLAATKGSIKWLDIPSSNANQIKLKDF
jgi:hypothetical protein